MANLKSKIFSPVIGEGTVALFHSSGANFLINESNILKVGKNVDKTFISLVEAMYSFDINESGIKAYYDLRNNRFVSCGDESSLNNANNFFSLTEMKQFLTEKRKQLKLSNQGEDIINEITEEINTVDAKLHEANNMPMVSSFTFDANEKKAYINSTEILDENIAEHIFSLGQVLYEHKGMLSLFEIASRNFNAYQKLEFISEIKEGEVTYSVMRKESESYVYRYNSETKLSTFKNMSITETIDYILENTGEDVSYMFEDILESAKQKNQLKFEKISNLHEMIAFLKDKRGDLADQDKNIEEIKEADHMINQEIKKLEKEIKVIEAEDLGRNDGYVPGTLEADLEEITAGTEIMVDALAYAAAGSDDSITFFLEDKPYKIEKRFIGLASGEAV